MHTKTSLRMTYRAIELTMYLLILGCLVFKRAAFLGLSKANSIKRFFADVDVETYLEVDGMCLGLVPSKRGRLGATALDRCSEEK
jgi:hypothetical protein